MEGNQIVALSSADVYKQGRRFCGSVEQAFFDRKPVYPVVSGTHGIAHEVVEIPENSWNGTKVLKGGHLSLKRILHEAIVRISWATMTRLSQILGSFHRSAHDHLSACDSQRTINRPETSIIGVEELTSYDGRQRFLLSPWLW